MKQKSSLEKLRKMKLKTGILENSWLLFILDFLSRPDGNSVFDST